MNTHNKLAETIAALHSMGIDIEMAPFRLHLSGDFRRRRSVESLDWERQYFFFSPDTIDVESS